MRNRRSLISEVSSRFVLLVLIVVSTFTWCELKLNFATRSFDCPSFGDNVPTTVLTSFLENLSSQKEQRASWAYAALAGLVAISVTKQKVLPVPWLRAAYMLLAAASVFLLESLHASDLFDRRVAYLVLQGKATDSDVMGLSSVLLEQLNFLYTAVLVLSLFVMSFVAAIVLGKVTPVETGGE